MMTKYEVIMRNIKVECEPEPVSSKDCRRNKHQSAKIHYRPDKWGNGYVADCKIANLMYFDTEAQMLLRY